MGGHVAAGLGGTFEFGGLGGLYKSLISFDIVFSDYTSILHYFTIFYSESF